MKKKNIIEKLSSGKGFYITAAVSFALIVAAIGFVYSSSVRLIEDLPAPTTTAAEEITQQVRKNKDDIADPRVTTTTAPTTTEKQSQTTTVPAEEEITSAEENEAISNSFFVFPVEEKVCKAFSTTPVYDETMEDWRIHKGTDFAAEKGADVVSVGDGKVVRVVSDPAWGYYVEIDHGAFIARYCSLEQGHCVGIDDIVARGDIIGRLADIPCESAAQSHLHFEIIKDGECIDPMTLLGEDADN